MSLKSRLTLSSVSVSLPACGRRCQNHRLEVSLTSLGCENQLHKTQTTVELYSEMQLCVTACLPSPVLEP